MVLVFGFGCHARFCCGRTPNIASVELLSFIFSLHFSVFNFCFLLALSPLPLALCLLLPLASLESGACATGRVLRYWFSSQSGTGVPPVKATRKMRVAPQN